MAKKNTLEWSKVVSELIFPWFWGADCIEKCLWNCGRKCRFWDNAICAILREIAQIAISQKRPFRPKWAHHLVLFISGGYLRTVVGDVWFSINSIYDLSGSIKFMSMVSRGYTLNPWNHAHRIKSWRVSFGMARWGFKGVEVTFKGAGFVLLILGTLDFCSQWVSERWY